MTAYVGPGREPRFVDTAATTNHQGKVEWPEYAEAIRSEERERCVLELLATRTRERFEDAFLEPPLRSTRHEHGFGTLYTAAYEPAARPRPLPLARTDAGSSRSSASSPAPATVTLS